MQILKPLKLGIAFFALNIVSHLQAAAEDIIKELQRDGLKFTVVYPNHFNSVGPFVITCQMKNITQQAIPYELTRESLGFSLILTNRENRGIPPKREWAKTYIPDPLGMGAHIAEQIEPGKSLIFKVNLYEAFGERALEGSRLTVKWDPGEDGYGNPLKLGRGLEIGFALPKLEAFSVNVSPAPIQQSTPAVETK